MQQQGHHWKAAHAAAGKASEHGAHYHVAPSRPRSAPRRALQRRRSRRRRRRRPRPPARTAQGGHGAAPPPSLGGRGKGRDSQYSSRARELDDDSTTPMGVRRTELRGAAFGRPPMLFFPRNIGLRLSLLVEERMRAPTPAFPSLLLPNPSSPTLLV